MKHKRSVLLAAASASVLALGVLPSASQADVASTCDSLIGSQTTTINLSPLTVINLSTCELAKAPSCGSQSGNINLGVVNINYAICKP